ncbi:MAG: radical SAM protein [Candidatus Aenigmarchaeota archaeon]|nr:radical SAM protein [Candidatus Aenigmarchaeota archaeon]
MNYNIVIRGGFIRLLFLNISSYWLSESKHPYHKLNPLDIGYCASILDKKGHETWLVDTEVKKVSINYITTLIKEKKIDVVILKPALNTTKTVLELAQEIKKHKIPIILIGPFVTHKYTDFLFERSPIDICIIGEPEYTLDDLISSIERNGDITKVNGIVFFKNNVVVNPRPLIENLDELPIPKHEFFINRGYAFYYPMNIRKKMIIGFMLASRGCSFHCSFCSVIERDSFGLKYRKRSPKNIVNEMAYLISKGVNAIYFIDDLFGADRKNLEDMCDEIIRRKLRINWAFQSRVGFWDVRLLKKMKMAGCSTMCFGIESGSQKILKMLNKGTTIEQIEQSVRNANSAGIDTVGYFIIGNPTETKTDILKTSKFIERLPLDMIQVHFFTPMPGSSSFDIYMNKIDNNHETYDIHNKPVGFLSDFSPLELKKYQKYLYKKFYLSPRFVLKYIFRMPFHILNAGSDIKLLNKAVRLFFV